MKFSACWIAKNEEKNIGRSIESLKAVCDEMIVVDTGSADETVKAAESAGARVEHFEWINDFSAAKNYALQKTSGDIVIFLDADEWFSPPLKKEDKRLIAQAFAQNPKLQVLQLKIHNLNSQGNVKTVSACDRIIKKKNGIAYHKPIHEVLLLRDKSTPGAAITDSWPILHSGYTEDILKTKMERNISLLEHAAEHSDSAQERHMHHCYLVREYYNSGKPEDSIRHLDEVLRAPELLAKQMKQYLAGIAPILYSMLVAAGDNREKVSRLEIYHKIVEPFKKYLDGYKGAATIELYYNALFGLSDDMLLSGLNAALERSDRMAETSVQYYKDAEATLCLRAASASLVRAKNVEALDYIMSAFKRTRGINMTLLKVLLKCLKGQAAQEVIAFLNGQFDIKNPTILNHLAVGTRMDGFGEAHAYYINKKIEAGFATKDDYLSLLLVYGKCADAAKAACDFYMETNPQLAGAYIFLSAVCAKDEAIYTAYKELLASVSDILDAYFSGGALYVITKAHAMILTEHFDNIAFWSGFERACDFLRVFSANPNLVFQVKAGYCVRNRLSGAVLHDGTADADNDGCNRLLAEHFAMRGAYTDAVDRLEAIFRKGTADKNLLDIALAIYDMSGDARAKQLYDDYSEAFNRLTDLTDMINTGYIPPEYAGGKGNVYSGAEINGLSEALKKASEMITD